MARGGGRRREWLALLRAAAGEGGGGSAGGGARERWRRRWRTQTRPRTRPLPPLIPRPRLQRRCRSLADARHPRERIARASRAIAAARPLPRRARSSPSHPHAAAARFRPRRLTTTTATTHDCRATRRDPPQAVDIWLRTNDLEHVFVVGSYFHYAGGFGPPSALEVSPNQDTTPWQGGSSQNVAYLAVVRATVDK